jgi:CBS domain containing-hemolysin-like protein
VDDINLGWTIALSLPVLTLHTVSVTLTRALRTYSRSRLEDVCARRGQPGLADDVAHNDARTERSAETLAVMTGLMLAALLGVLTDRLAPRLATESILVLAIALAVGAVGYVMAGVVGRVFAERVIVALWPAAFTLRLATGPLTYGSRQVESLVERLARLPDDAPRPTSVEVEIPTDADHPDDSDADLPEATRELVKHAVELTRRDVAELMTPSSHIVTLPSSISARAAARIFRETGKSRLPLYGESRDDVVGVLYAKDLFPRMTDAADPDAVVPRKIARTAYCVPETKNAYELLDEFRSKRTQIAIVLNEYGGVAGLITLEDLVEELVGAIDDEHDVPTPDDPVVPLGGSRYEVDATLDLESLNERLGLRLPTDGDFLTVGGFAFHELGRLPEAGASFRHEGIEFQIVEVVDHSIRRVRIDLQPAAAVGS